MLNDLPLVRTIIDFLVLIVVACHAGFNLWDRRNKVTQEVIAALRAEVSEQLSELRGDLELRRRRVDENLEGLHRRVSDVPSHKDVASLYESINTLATTVNQLVGETKMQSDLLRMLINREVNK